MRRPRVRVFTLTDISGSGELCWLEVSVRSLPSPLLRAAAITAVLALPATILGACDNDESGSSSGGGGGNCAASPTLPAVETLFTTRCAGSSCHRGGPSGVFPPLAAGEPSAWLGLKSHEDASKQLVVPGKPEQSWIYMKVSGAQGPQGGALMPLGVAAPIPEIVAIKEWILAGAP